MASFGENLENPKRAETLIVHSTASHISPALESLVLAYCRGLVGHPKDILGQSWGILNHIDWGHPGAIISIGFGLILNYHKTQTRIILNWVCLDTY